MDIIHNADEERMKWKTLSSEYLFNDTWLRARRDKCQKSDGKIVYPYYIVEYPQWATGMGLTEDNKVVLVKQYRHAVEMVSIEIPGGCIDATDANPEAAIRREFIEETGYTFEKVEYLGKTSPNPSTNTNWMHMFLLTGGRLTHPQSFDENEEIEVLLVSLDEFVQMVLSNQIIQAMHMTTIFFALQRMGKLSIDL